MSKCKKVSSKCQHTRTHAHTITYTHITSHISHTPHTHITRQTQRPQHTTPHHNPSPPLLSTHTHYTITFTHTCSPLPPHVPPSARKRRLKHHRGTVAICENICVGEQRMGRGSSKQFPGHLLLTCLEDASSLKREALRWQKGKMW